MNEGDIEAWYLRNEPHAGALARHVEAAIKQQLEAELIPYASVTHRVKAKSSLVTKVHEKRYTDLDTQVTDLTALRVVLYRESDVAKACAMLRSSFRVHERLSEDKSAKLGMDRFGYRSVHLLCDVGPTRKLLPEYKGLGERIFEIQVRTVLQHAWAELQHDRGYKFGAGLPTEIGRRLSAVAAVLELADFQLDEITKAIDAHRVKVQRETDQMMATPLDVLSFDEVMQAQAASVHWNVSPTERLDDDLRHELASFGVRTIGDLRTLLSAEVLQAVREGAGPTNTVGAIRAVMMYVDLDRYFADCWGDRWMDDPNEDDLWTWLETKYGAARVSQYRRRTGGGSVFGATS